MPKINLLPCPFCGAPAEFELWENSPYGPTWHVGCSNGADDNESMSCCLGFSVFKVPFARRRDAATLWNKRAMKMGDTGHIRKK